MTPPEVVGFSDKKASDLIAAMTTELSKHMPAGAYQWIKRKRPRVFSKTIVLENEMHEAMVNGNMESLKEVIEEYKLVWIRGFKEFGVCC